MLTIWLATVSAMLQRPAIVPAVDDESEDEDVKTSDSGVWLWLGLALLP